MSIGVGVMSQVSTTGILALMQTLPGLRRVIDAGEVDRVRTPAQHRGEEGVLARGRIAGQAEEHLVAGLPQAVGQRLDRLDEDGVGDRGDQRGDEPGALGGEAARQQVRHIARAVDDLLHVREGVGGDELGPVDHAGHGDRRNAGKLGHVRQRHAARGRGWKGPGGAGRPLVLRGGGHDLESLAVMESHMIALSNQGVQSAFRAAVDGRSPGVAA